MRRLALLLAVLAALGVPAAADARPRKPLRGHVKRMRPGMARVAVAPLRSVGASTLVPAATAPAPAPATAPAADPPPVAPPLPGASGRSLQVRTFDDDPDVLRLVLSRTTVLAGDVRVELNNSAAQDEHDLVLEPVGHVGTTHAFEPLAKGAVLTRTFALNAGSWVLYCGLLDHRARGMEAALAVA